MMDQWAKYAIEDGRKSLEDSKSFELRVNQFSDSYKEVGKRIGLGDTDSILDLGCGFGELAVSFKQRFSKYVGVDVSNEKVELAKKIVIEKRVENTEFLTLDMTEFGLNKSFDKVIALTSLDHVRDKKAALKNLNDTLKRGGLLYVEVRNRDYLPKKILKSIKIDKKKITVSYGGDDFEDLNRREWIELIESSGFKLVSEYKSVRPYFYGSISICIKGLIRILSDLFGKDTCYMLAFKFEKSEIEE